MCRQDGVDGGDPRGVHVYELSEVGTLWRNEPSHDHSNSRFRSWGSVGDARGNESRENRMRKFESLWAIEAPHVGPQMQAE
jgi:hypothetical protein